MKLLLPLHNSNVRNGTLYTFFAFINNGISFIMILVLAKFLSIDEYGILHLFNTFITLLAIFISFGTASYIAVSYFKCTKMQLQQIIFFVIATTTCVFLFFCCAIFLFPSVLQSITGLAMKYMLVGLLICFGQVIVNINLDIWRLEEQPLKYGLFSGIMMITNVVGTFLLVLWAGLGWTGRMYAQFFAVILFTAVSLWTLIIRGYIVPQKIDKKMIQQILLFALPLIPHTASFWIKQGLDRYIINYYYDASMVAVYSFAFNFANIIIIAGQAFNTGNAVYIYKHLADASEKSKTLLIKQNRLMLWIFLAFMLCVLIGSSFLIPYILPKYMDSIKYLPPLCFGAFFQCIYFLYVNYLFFYSKTKQLMYITLSTALLQAILSLLLTKYSITYTAYISMFIYGITMIVVYCSAKHIIEHTSQ